MAMLPIFLIGLVLGCVSTYMIIVCKSDIYKLAQDRIKDLEVRNQTLEEQNEELREIIYKFNDSKK